MSNEIKKLKVLPDLIPDIKFNLKAQEKFANNRGIVLEHWSAIPSPIGLKDRGDYRRSDSLDTISENGFLFKKVGEFRATIVGNSRINQMDNIVESGIYDNSTARIIIPKFYSKTVDGEKNKEISLLPGDRVYTKDIESKVANYQRCQYSVDHSDFLQFPAVCVERLVDSNNIEYIQDKHFKIDNNGNIAWIKGQKNPGIDAETGEGRIYSIRYKYVAFWYVSNIINEIRVTNDENGKAQRMPYHAIIQREYVYHNKNKGDDISTNNKTQTKRTVQEPSDKLDVDNFQVQVDAKNYKK